MKLTKGVEELYKENHEILLKGIKDTVSGKTIHTNKLVELMLLSCP